MANESRGMVPIEEVPEAKRTARERISADVKAFLKAGGRIKRVKAGVSSGATTSSIYNSRQRKAKGKRNDK